MLLALSGLEELDSVWDFLESLQQRSVDISSLALAGPLSACDRRGLRGTLVEQRLLILLSQCPDLGFPARNAIAAAMADVGGTAGASSIPGELNALSRRLQASRGGFSALPAEVKSVLSVQPGTRLAGPSRPHEKEARLLGHVLSAAPAGDPQAICQAMEEFGRNSLSRPYGGGGGWAHSAGQWLKLAGGDKAEVLTMAAKLAGPSGRFLEVGTYCGYSAVHLASVAGEGVKVVTLDADPGCAIIARNIIAFAGLSHRIDARIGHSEDFLPLLATALESSQDCHFNLVFFDQRGSRYTTDINVLERLQALPQGAVVVADNVLKPGAPAFLWHMLFSGLYDTQIVTVEEFSMPGVEDWMSVSIRRPGSEQLCLAPPLPREMQLLEWEADCIRSRAERSPGVNFEAWAKFATRMRDSLAAHGIYPGCST